MIKSFKDPDTKQLFDGERVRQWQAIENIARRKLVMVDAAAKLDDLKVPPNNKLHKLDKDREGQYAISINDQYRICFEWKNGDTYYVEMTDYHS